MVVFLNKKNIFLVRLGLDGEFFERHLMVRLETSELSPSCEALLKPLEFRNTHARKANKLLFRFFVIPVCSNWSSSTYYYISA